jgi:hypothetical protein
MIFEAEHIEAHQVNRMTPSERGHEMKRRRSKDTK